MFSFLSNVERSIRQIVLSRETKIDELHEYLYVFEKSARREHVHMCLSGRFQSSLPIHVGDLGIFLTSMTPGTKIRTTFKNVLTGYNEIRIIPTTFSYELLRNFAVTLKLASLFSPRLPEG